MLLICTDNSKLYSFTLSKIYVFEIEVDRKVNLKFNKLYWSNDGKYFIIEDKSNFIIGSPLMENENKENEEYEEEPGETFNENEDNNYNDNEEENFDNEEEFQMNRNIPQNNYNEQKNFNNNNYNEDYDEEEENYGNN